MPLYSHLYADIIFSYTDLRSGLECSHPHNILQLSCALQEDSSYVEYWSRQIMQDPPSSMMARQGPFLLTINHSDETQRQQSLERHFRLAGSTIMNLEFILGAAHKNFPHIFICHNHMNKQHVTNVFLTQSVSP
jgi:hypothetical protein